MAEGQIPQIRDLIDRHPHRIVLVSDAYRALAAKVICWDDVEGVEIERDASAVLIETRTPDSFYARLPSLALDGETPIREVYSEDNDLEAVFKYLVSK